MDSYHYESVTIRNGKYNAEQLLIKTNFKTFFKYRIKNSLLYSKFFHDRRKNGPTIIGKSVSSSIYHQILCIGGDGGTCSSMLSSWH